MDYLQLLKDTLYFLAIVNPPSKILFLSAYQPPLSFRDNLQLSRTASLVAAAILLVTAIAGNFVLKDIFRIDLYSLKICGGIILFFSGFSAVRHGHFMLDDNHKVRDFSEVSIIPLAAPLIAGPGTIAIGMTLASVSGIIYAVIVIILAITCNFLFMIFAIVLLVFGHGLNMILNVLSVIVHGIRLNTLEFSSHLDMSWSGHKFKPFEN